MFAPDTALYLKKIKTGVETIDQETRKLLILEWEAQPFTREMADELGLAYLHVLRRRSTPLHQQLHDLWKTTFILNTGYQGSSELADLNEIVATGESDLVSVGRLFISNPDLVSRWEKGLPLAEWNEDTFFTSGPAGLTDYPFAT